jgi:hypothetical protein
MDQAANNNGDANYQFDDLHFRYMTIDRLKAFVQEDPQRVNKVRDRDGHTILGTAAEYPRYAELLEWLLETAAADPNVRDGGGRTPIFETCYREDVDNARAPINLLLAADADPTVHDHEGGTPLMEFAATSNTSCVKRLLKDPRVAQTINAQNNYGCTVLNLYSRREFVDNDKYIEGIMVLLNAGADPWIRAGDEEATVFDNLCSVYNYHPPERVALVRALEMEHERAHLLHKVRNLCDAARDLAGAKAQAAAPQEKTQQQQQAAKYVPQPYVKERVEKGWELPLVLLAQARPRTQEEKEKKEQLMAVIEFALGGVRNILQEGTATKGEKKGPEGGQEKPILLKEHFHELIDMISPRWDPKRMEEEGRRG